MSLCVYILMDDSLVVDRGFRSCVMTIRDGDTYVDLIIFYILDFDMILAWIGYPSIMRHRLFCKYYCLAMPDIPLIMW